MSEKKRRKYDSRKMTTKGIIEEPLCELRK